jgi:hypothetical protein
MMIRPPEPDDLSSFARSVIRLLDDRQLAYAICGSLAAMEYSEPRLSIDVDLMVLAAPEELAGFVHDVERWGIYVTPLEVILSEMIPLGRPFNIIDGRSGSKADVYPVTRTGLAGSAMSRRRRRIWDSESGEQAWFLSPEDVILFKLQHYRLGGEVAQKHPADIARMLAVLSDDLDTGYIERWAGELSVADLWLGLWRLHRGRDSGEGAR